jgi:hypothetical protein
MYTRTTHAEFHLNESGLESNLLRLPNLVAEKPSSRVVQQHMHSDVYRHLSDVCKSMFPMDLPMLEEPTTKMYLVIAIDGQGRSPCPDSWARGPLTEPTMSYPRTSLNRSATESNRPAICTSVCVVSSHESIGLGRASIRSFESFGICRFDQVLCILS